MTELMLNIGTETNEHRILLKPHEFKPFLQIRAFKRFKQQIRTFNRKCLLENLLAKAMIEPDKYKPRCTCKYKNHIIWRINQSSISLDVTGKYSFDLQIGLRYSFSTTIFTENVINAFRRLLDDQFNRIVIVNGKHWSLVKKEPILVLIHDEVDYTV